MDQNTNLWIRYNGQKLETILKDLYLKTLGKNAPSNADPKTLLLSICSFYQALLDNMPGTVFWLDKNDHYLGGNKTMLEVLNFDSMEQLIGKNSVELGKILNWPQTQLQDILENNCQVFETGKPIINKQEEPFIDARGTTWVQLTNKVPIKNQNDEVELLLGVCLNISDRIQLINELKQQKQALNDILHKLYKEILGIPILEEEDPKNLFFKICHFYKSLLDNMPGSVYWIDKNDRYLGCNKNLLKMLNFKRHEDIIGKTSDDLRKILNWSENQLTDIVENNSKVFHSGEPVINKQEAPFTDVQGKKWIQLTNKVPVKNQNGEVEMVLGVSIDISDRIQLMEELAKQKENAEAANHAKTEFLENMRHDIRTPLTGILGCCELILENATDPKKILESTENIRSATYAFLHFMNRMLEIARVADGTLPNRIDRFQTKAPIQYVVDLLKVFSYTKNINLVFNYDENIPPIICCNLDQFFKIFYEILKNAITFTYANGTVELLVKLVKKNEHTALIQADIKDTGIGMSQDQIRQIFAPFSKVSPSYLGTHKGIGIGLTLTKKFVEDFKGEIYVAESIEGKGTTIRINLPLSLPLTEDHMGLITNFHYLNENPADLFFAKKNVTPNHSASISEEFKILVVEDNSMAAAVVKNILNRFGFVVDIATTGKQGIALAEVKQYELIFMDIGLPDVDGFEVTRTIRTFTWNTNSTIPIIALTAHIDTENQKNCIDAGINTVLSKPLKVDVAIDILQKFIPHTFQSNQLDFNQVNQHSFKSQQIIEENLANLEQSKKPLEDSKKIAYHIIKTLTEGFGIQLSQIEQAFENKDLEKLRAIAQTLKGSTYYARTFRLLEAYTQLEQSTQAKDTDCYEAQYLKLLKEIENYKSNHQYLYKYYIE